MGGITSGASQHVGPLLVCREMAIIDGLGYLQDYLQALRGDITVCIGIGIERWDKPNIECIGCTGVSWSDRENFMRILEEKQVPGRQMNRYDVDR